MIEHMGIILNEYLADSLDKCERDFISSRSGISEADSGLESSRMTLMEEDDTKDDVNVTDMFGDQGLELSSLK